MILKILLMKYLYRYIAAVPSGPGSSTRYSTPSATHISTHSIVTVWDEPRIPNQLICDQSKPMVIFIV